MLPKIKKFISLLPLDLFVLVFFLVLSLVAWKVTQNLVQKTEERRLSLSAEKVQSGLDLRMNRYVAAILNLKAFYESSAEVDRAEFQKFQETVNSEKRYGGIYTFSFVRKVEKVDLKEFEKRLNDEVGAKLGNLDKEKDYHYIVDYLYRPDGSSDPYEYGVVLSENQIRKEFFDNVSNTGTIKMSGPFDIIKINENPKGFLISAPIFKESELLGFVNAVVVSNEAFPLILNELVSKSEYDLGIIIKDGDEVIYRSFDESNGQGVYLKTIDLSVGGRVWNVEYYNFSEAESSGLIGSFPITVLVVGILASFLIFSVTFALGRANEKNSEFEDEKTKLVSSIESLSKGYVLVDMKGQIAITNKKLNEILGEETSWTIEKLQQKIGTQLDLLFCLKATTNQGKSFFSDRLTVNEKYLDIYINPVVTTTTTTIGTLILIGDITEEKAMDRSKDEFFSIASHELRTPLTAIRGNTSMIKDYFKKELENKDLAGMIDDVHDASVRLISIVNDFLSLGRLEMGKIEFRHESVDVLALVKSVVEELGDLLRTKNLSIKINEGSAPFPLVMADNGHLREVLVNLIGNSIKFTEKGIVTIDLVKEGEFGKVSVTDQGRGIPLQNQKLLFHKFQQAGSSLITRDTTKGTGLGLYISKLIVEGMGGKIWLERSEEGKGSTFAFSLPISKSAN